VNNSILKALARDVIPRKYVSGRVRPGFNHCQKLASASIPLVNPKGWHLVMDTFWKSKAASRSRLAIVEIRRGMNHATMQKWVTIGTPE
jgi:hypothetical protein